MVWDSASKNTQKDNYIAIFIESWLNRHIPVFFASISSDLSNVQVLLLKRWTGDAEESGSGSFQRRIRDFPQEVKPTSQGVLYM